MATVKKDVEKVAKVVKNVVGAQQEEQLHQLAQQNHQEMLESLDDQKQQQAAKQPIPREVNNAGVVKQNAQPAGQLVQQQAVVQQLDTAGGYPQAKHVNFMQGKAEGQDQVLDTQQQFPGQQQEPQVQGAADHLKNSNVKQQSDEQRALNFVHEQGFLTDQLAQHNSIQGQPVYVQKNAEPNLGKQIHPNNPVQAQPVQQGQGKNPLPAVEQPIAQAAVRQPLG